MDLAMLALWSFLKQADQSVMLYPGLPIGFATGLLAAHDHLGKADKNVTAFTNAALDL